jgi:hypothetical protein
VMLFWLSWTGAPDAVVNVGAGVCSLAISLIWRDRVPAIRVSGRDRVPVIRVPVLVSVNL